MINAMKQITKVSMEKAKHDHYKQIESNIEGGTVLLEQEMIVKCERKIKSSLNSLAKDLILVKEFYNACEVTGMKPLILTVVESIQGIIDATTLNTKICDAAIVKTQELVKEFQRESKRKKHLVQQALSDMETWKKRRESSKEYPIAMMEEENAWRLSNETENARCLRKMRSLIPTNIKSLNTEQLISLAKTQRPAVIYTYELASYLKQNRFLHWIVTHPSDIASDNFLAGNSSHYFTNFEQYDITELRALVHCLPESFTFDADGRKAAWRESFIAHVKTLVKQQNGEAVNAGWDPVNQKRRLVKLKPLDSRQAFNKVYRYETKAEIEFQMEKFDGAVKRLQDKRDRLLTIINAKLPAAKEEYDAVLADARCRNMQKTVGKDQLVLLR